MLTRNDVRKGVNQLPVSDPRNPAANPFVEEQALRLTEPTAIIGVRLLRDRRCQGCGAIGYVEEKNQLCCVCYGALLDRMRRRHSRRSEKKKKA